MIAGIVNGKAPRSMDIQKLIANFEKRNINAYFVTSGEEAVRTALQLIQPGSRIGFGGSVTLEQIGILDLLRERDDVKLLDRTKVKDPEDLYRLYVEMFDCDVFLSSANAVTMQGQLVNVDGRGNRVAMMTFGPRRVILIVGKNKITRSLEAAIERIRKIACPLNVKRMKKLAESSPIASTIEITEERIWGQVSIIERQLDGERIHVIIVDEELGF
jgi:L-lactate utilization protein LutB